MNRVSLLYQSAQGMQFAVHCTDFACITQILHEKYAGMGGGLWCMWHPIFSYLVCLLGILSMKNWKDCILIAPKMYMASSFHQKYVEYAFCSYSYKACSLQQTKASVISICPQSVQGLHITKEVCMLCHLDKNGPGHGFCNRSMQRLHFAL